MFIGGCAGFAAEAFSSILISATWGPQASKEIEHEENVELIEGPDAQNEGLTDGSEDEQEENIYNHDKPPNFFGSTATSSASTPPRNRKGKEPLIPRVESWRDSLSTSSTASSPVLIRRMKLSSTDTKSNWDWDEDNSEEEEEVEFNHHLKNK
ncbi:hypothetical protein G6F42_021731 [Rhizopus arrhizus]|nr:hypothetical protein G6F42_021731 [Rhizopus arrhizus]